MGKLAEIRVPEELIASARSGDEAAQARLYAAVAPATYGLIYRLTGSRAVAEDLFQETLMTVFERLDTFRGEAPLGAWVRQIAVSRCLMYLRSPWHRARVELGAWADGESAAPGGVAGPSAAAAQYGLTGSSAAAAPCVVAPPSADSLDVERALASLSPTARAVVWLFEVEGYSHQEIARAFGRTASFSKSQLARAHRRLREWLEPSGERQPCTPV